MAPACRASELSKMRVPLQQCLDKQRNFILQDVEETMMKVDEETGQECAVRRKLSQVMVCQLLERPYLLYLFPSFSLSLLVLNGVWSQL